MEVVADGGSETRVLSVAGRVAEGVGTGSAGGGVDTDTLPKFDPPLGIMPWATARSLAGKRISGSGPLQSFQLRVASGGLGGAAAGFYLMLRTLRTMERRDRESKP